MPLVSDSEREARFRRYLQFTSLVVGGEVHPHWMAGGNRFWYADVGEEGRIIWRVDPEAGTREPFFDEERLRTALAGHLGHAVVAAGIPFNTFQLDSLERHATFTLDGRDLTLDLQTYEIEEPVFPPWPAERGRETPRLVQPAWQEGESDLYEVPSPTGNWLVGASDGNLTLRSPIDDATEPLTLDGTPEYCWDLGSVQWAPDGLRLVAAKIDNRGVRRLPVVRWLKQHEDIDWYVFPRTGDAMPRIELYAIDVRSRRQTLLDTGSDPDAMLFPAAWTADGRAVRIIRLGRTMKPMWLLEADPATGNTRVLLSEPIETYVAQSNLDEPVEGVYTPLTDGRFIWLSGRSGFSQLYLHDADGALIGQLTSGDFPVLGVVAVDEAHGWVYFAANGEERLYDTNLYRVDFEGNGLERLTEGRGLHTVIMSPSREFFVDTYSSPTDPPIVELRSVTGDLVQVLSRADITALEELGWHPPEEFVVPAADGETPLYGVLYLPADFDPARKYPVIDYIYGGPQVIVTPHTFAVGYAGGQTGPLLGGTFQRALSQLGFVVMMVDARGTRGRSQAFHDVSYGHFGTTVIPDHVAALQNVAATRPYMDLSHVGICGLSWGGYNTLRAMLTAPEVYHVGVATNPAADLDDHFGEWAEGVMGLRHENIRGYEEASNVAVAGNLQGKLLLVHSTSDTNATFSTTMKMVNAFIDAGKPYDLLVLPEQTHHPLGTRQEYWIDAMCRYFIEHLICGKEQQA
jgi:dipeptidyl aminopeptidase/acylaminoacyl peptidase